ncbi:unnamed protein product [Ceutorhynchus assimilis]|uniref:FP protein C-terminal domain-containing protein n=1 Tax=Ceutorhynchus assimilis TaxID=467358 RepID=A0A9N9MXX2_9CUCU|nr:unnamed protein product [Ceutorhynchus assimilis]
MVAQKNINQALSEEIKTLKAENIEMQKEIRSIKNQNMIREQEAKTNNVVPVGMKNTIDEQKTCLPELKNKTDKVLNYIDFSIRPSDYKVRIINMNKENSPILVTFQTQQQKLSVLSKRREKGKIISNDCGLEGPSPIFVNEDLTSEQRRLFRSARTLREKDYQYVWVKGGRVFVRRSGSEDVVRVRTDEDIQRLCET